MLAADPSIIERVLVFIDQERNAEDIAVEVRRSVDVAHLERDEHETANSVAHHETPPKIICAGTWSPVRPFDSAGKQHADMGA